MKYDNYDELFAAIDSGELDADAMRFEFFTHGVLIFHQDEKLYVKGGSLNNGREIARILLRRKGFVVEESRPPTWSGEKPLDNRE